MAVVNTWTFIGTTSSPTLWTWKIVVTEMTGSVVDYTSPVKVEAYLGRASGADSSYFQGTAKLTLKAGSETYTKNYSSGGRIDIAAGAWKSLGSNTFNVSNSGGPNTISVSGKMSNAVFNPSSASASGSVQLSVLHTPPTIAGVSVSELNTSLGVTATQFVNYLSNKRFTITATPYDSAHITLYEVYDSNNVRLGYSSTNIVDCNLSGKSLPSNDIIIKVTDDKGGVSSRTYTYSRILYFAPQLTDTTTTMIRQTGGSVSLTENKIVFNLNGLVYHSSDTIGNRNSLANLKIRYKIWRRDKAEPAYSNSLVQTTDTDGTVLTRTDEVHGSATLSGNNLIINNYVISGINFRQLYNYKIQILDYYSKPSNEKVGTIPTGLAVWSEYPDHVNFIKLTQNNHDIQELLSTTTGTLTLVKSSGNSTATGTYSKYGNIVSYEINISTTGTTASGDNIWVGSVSDFTPSTSATLIGYLGSRSIIAGLTTGKALTIRNAGQTSISSGSTLSVRGTFII